MFITGGYMLAKGQENKAYENASKLAFDDIERALLGAAVAAPKENAPGSYERLVKGFGQVNARAAMS